MRVDNSRLEQLAKNLGAKAEANLDVDAVAASVVERLKEQPEPVVWWRRTSVLSGVAAAAVIVVAVGVLTDGGDGSGPLGSGFSDAPAQLEALSLDELEEVFDSLDFEAPVSELAHAGLEDMSLGQLEELLQTKMEE